jgi:tRNA(Leu) C34 or U34 (ribose-2'-O)-methylase TrmL|tara:strand:- start:342 stop:863 length:522 start_codon:yes stop_codon:yes gene_type:complete
MKKTQVSLGLVNPKSPDNVGSVLRAAANYGVDNVFYTGDRYPRAIERKARTVDMSRKVSKDVMITQKDSLLDVATENMRIVCVEFVVNAIPLPEYEHPDSALYIFGPEDGSIDQSIIDKANDIIYVPTVGCMNLSASVIVLLYDRLFKTGDYNAGNTLIRKNRDINNRLIDKR